MRVFGESSWCFCSGGGKSEKMKSSIFCNRGGAMTRVGGGTGFLIHKNLLLTTHANLPSMSAAEGLEIQLKDRVAVKLFLTDAIDGDSNIQGHQPQCLKTCSNPSLDLGNLVYLLGYTDKKELKVDEGKVVIATDNLIKVSTDGIIWSPGSAGFDAQGNLAFMVCDPMKLATSPTVKSTSTSSSSSSPRKKDLPVQFGIPIPIICDWLNQHWEGSLGELSKPKLPLIRLMSTGQKSEHSCASFTMRQVFKSTEIENGKMPSSSNTTSGQQDHPGPSCSAAANVCLEETPATDLRPTSHEQGIPTPEIYESPRLTSLPVGKKENTQIQLLDINFPPSGHKAIAMPRASRVLPQSSDQNTVEQLAFLLTNGYPIEDREAFSPVGDNEISTGSVNGDHSEIQSSSSPIVVSEWRREGHRFLADYSSDGETTMYSAETAESRNYPSPKVENFQSALRTRSCGSYNRQDTTQRNPRVARRPLLDNQQSFIQGRKMHSQGAISQRSNDYFNPTVSSIMKKRHNSEQQNKTRHSASNSSPRWVF